MSVYELSARELFDAYGGGASPDHLLDEGRTAIATRLRTEEDLREKEAYFAADQMLAFAAEQLNSTTGRQETET
jgi:hypothetical protein